jgi:prepilin signal peptidase PulO-like enzyme (type II secretory pathway)
VLLTIVFILGSAIGSFVQLIAARLHVAPILQGRSKCLSCGEALRAWDLVPIVSNVLSAGKCRQCGIKFGFESAIFELLSGVYFVLVFVKIILVQSSVLASFLYGLFYLLLFIALGVIALYDLKHSIVPKKFLLLFLVLSTLMMCYRGYAESSWFVLMGPVFVAFPFAFLYFASSLLAKREWLGFGDVLVFLGVGAFFGVSQGYAVFIISVWAGALWGVVQWIAHKSFRHRGIEVPFVPFIVFAFLLVLFTDISILSVANMFVW